MRSRSAVAIIVFGAALQQGCQAPVRTGKRDAHPQAAVELSRIFPKQDIRAGAPSAIKNDVVPSQLNAPMPAAKDVATMPGLQSVGVKRAITMPAALYRAAMEFDAWNHSAYFLLPSDRPTLVDGQRALSQREFCLRVLAQFMAARKPVAWENAALAQRYSDRAHAGPAAQVWFEIVQDETELATVIADVCCTSPDQGTHKARVEAIYDGAAWTVRDLGIRTAY